VRGAIYFLFLLCLTFKMNTRCCYTEFELNLLKELVGKRIDILENKKSDYKTINEKNLTWKLLSNEYNSYEHVKKRKDKQLKKCWENLKARAKQTGAKERRERLVPGKA